MFLIIVALLWSMKIVVMVESKADKRIDLNFWQWLSFSVGWFGMKPNLFSDFRSAAKPDWFDYVIKGWIRIALGIVSFLVSIFIWHSADSLGLRFAMIVSIILLMTGISFTVHFGLFNLLTGFFRSQGVNVRSLFNAPLLSRSLTEFWGRRWNLAFSEMTAIGVFRPLRKVFGNGVATNASFLFSGLLHELAISIPVNSGYGLPLLYFALHGAAMTVERKLDEQGVNWLKNPIVGRVWTMAWILIPVPILFHWAFLKGCVAPLLNFGFTG